jgi:hypothetical protein
VPGEPDVGVRDHNTLEFGIIEVFAMSTFHEGTVVTPIPVYGKNETS